MRECVFRGDTIIPQAGQYVRKVGRPRQEWTTGLLRAGAERFGFDHFRAMLTDSSDGAQQRWKQNLDRVFKA